MFHKKKRAKSVRKGEGGGGEGGFFGSLHLPDFWSTKQSAISLAGSAIKLDLSRLKKSAEWLAPPPS